jgi:hypothetical protein
MKLPAVLILCCALVSCNNPMPESHAVYVLIDRTGVYAQSFDDVRTTVRLLLSKLEPGDSLAVARIDNEFFTVQDVVVAITFSSRPSNANKQKRALLNAIDKLAVDTRAGSYTDITGGMLKATEWLNATRASNKLIIVFSEFPDEPRTGYMHDFPVNYNGAKVVVWNVLMPVQVDSVTLTESSTFTERTKGWQSRVLAGGGSWWVVSDPAAVISILH